MATAHTTLQYQSGFGNTFETEAIAGALPQGRNSPQRCAFGLYAEQITGSAFTAPRAENKRSWLYRSRPAAVHSAFKPYSKAVGELLAQPSPNNLRWNPAPLPEDNLKQDFVQGLQLMAGNGDALSQQGAAIYRYTANASMHHSAFYSADGELLIVPQQGTLRLRSELGIMDVAPQCIALVPRGIRFAVELLDAQARGSVRGYMCENFGAPLRLPDLGSIGSNGLANPRDFLIPVAAYETGDTAEMPHTLIAKFGGSLWQAEMAYSPFNVVAWHGNYVPYTYDLRRFNTIGSISYDHPDPSIFLVLHSPSDTAGTSNLDFVIFPPRILVAQDTFRPPWFHRNIASEFMGLIHGEYDGKSNAKADGFLPGGASLHNCMTGHGPDAATFAKASTADTTVPHHITDTMAFMFETRQILRPSIAAMAAPTLQQNYQDSWLDLQNNFKG